MVYCTYYIVDPLVMVIWAEDVVTGTSVAVAGAAHVTQSQGEYRDPANHISASKLSFELRVYMILSLLRCNSNF